MNSPDAVTGPVNLGNPVEVTMRELADRVRAQTGSKSACLNQPLPQDDPKQRKPDISLARGQLSWKPGVSLEDGLEMTIGYFREKLQYAQSAVHQESS